MQTENKATGKMLLNMARSSFLVMTSILRIFLLPVHFFRCSEHTTACSLIYQTFSLSWFRYGSVERHNFAECKVLNIRL